MARHYTNLTVRVSLPESGASTDRVYRVKLGGEEAHLQALRAWHGAENVGELHRRAADPITRAQH